MSILDSMTLSDGRELDSLGSDDPYDLMGEIEAQMPLSLLREHAPSVALPGDPSSSLKPKAGGKKMKMQDYGPAIQKMLARNKNRSQFGKLWLDDEAQNTTRMYYANHGDDS